MRKRASRSAFREFAGAATTRECAERDVDIAADVAAAAESKIRIIGIFSPHKINYLPHAKMKVTSPPDGRPSLVPRRTAMGQRVAPARLN
jgi:hypothetical protein